VIEAVHGQAVSHHVAFMGTTEHTFPATLILQHRLLSKTPQC
jgi:hypothetical protein